MVGMQNEQAKAYAYLTWSLGSTFLNAKIICHQRHLTKCPLEEGIADEREWKKQMSFSGEKHYFSNIQTYTKDVKVKDY